MDNRKIGIFDSGIGGLNVLKDLITAYPHEDFLYLADTFNLPYGKKTTEELIKIVNNNIDYLYKQNVKAIVIACNTASANSNYLNLDIPIYRIIEPTANIANSLNKDVAILATDYTINSNAYEKYLKVKSIGVKCSEFVSLIENPNTQKDDIKIAIEKVLKDLLGKDVVVILGCTHFSIIEKDIKEFLGDVCIIDSSLSMTNVLKDFLKDNYANNTGKVDIVVTGSEELQLSWFKKNINSIKYGL